LIFPPATEEQAQAAEMKMGRPLPSLLRDLYLQIANGGFGPSYGLLGLEDGYQCEESTIIVETLLHEDDKERGLFFDEEEIQATGFFTFYEHGPLPSARPFGCIRLSDDGCALYSWLHLDSQRVFQSGYWGNNQMRYKLMASSLEEWFETWLAEEVDVSQYCLDQMLNFAVIHKLSP